MARLWSCSIGWVVLCCIEIADGLLIGRPRHNPPVVTALHRPTDAAAVLEGWTHRRGFSFGPLSWGSAAAVSDGNLPFTRVSHRQMQALRAVSRTVAASQPAEARGARAFGDSAASAPSGEENNVPASIVVLRDLCRSEYVGDLGVGTANGDAESRLRVVYDTGSADFWVASDLCKSFPCVGSQRRRFNHTRSETFVAPNHALNFSTVYGSGELRGELGIDDIHVGTLVARRQPFGLIASEEGDAFARLPFDGIVGLGFSALAVDGAPTLYDTLVEQNSLPGHQFAFYLHRSPAIGGAVLWGGSDDRLYDGPVRWFPVSEEFYWSLDLEGFIVGDSVFNFTASDLASSKDSFFELEGTKKPPRSLPRIIVDSGTTYFSAEGQVYNAIVDSIQPLPCSGIDRLPDLVYVLRDAEGRLQNITVPPQSYMVTANLNEDMCYPGIVPMPSIEPGRDTMILGEVFMRHFFTVFKRGPRGGAEGSFVGFAPARFDAAATAAMTSGHAAVDSGLAPLVA